MLVAEHFERRARLDHRGRALAADDVDMPGGGDRGREDVRHTFEPLHLVVRLARLGIERRQHARVGLQEIDDPVVRSGDGT